MPCSFLTAQSVSRTQESSELRSRMKAYAIRVAIEDEHLPVALQRAEHVVAPQHEAPKVRSYTIEYVRRVLCAYGWNA
jgi:hypothetical protein